MRPEFWHERWDRNEIGFHLPHVNPLLHAHWERLELPAGSRVLVPLCGKTLDMPWLLERGHEVVGVEISRRAVEAFAEEQNIALTAFRHGGFEVWSAGRLSIWCGDFFDLAPDSLGPVDAVYDRGSLVALPGELRQTYAAQLTRLVPPGAPSLLITLDYPPAEMDGPPFPLDPTGVRALFDGDWAVTEIEVADVLADNPRFAERGLTRLEERVFRLTRLSPPG
jgi:thiopurine S-methyltransferase